MVLFPGAPVALAPNVRPRSRPALQRWDNRTPASPEHRWRSGQREPSAAPRRPKSPAPPATVQHVCQGIAKEPWLIVRGLKARLRPGSATGLMQGRQPAGISTALARAIIIMRPFGKRPRRLSTARCKLCIYWCLNRRQERMVVNRLQWTLQGSTRFVVTLSQDAAHEDGPRFQPLLPQRRY